MEPNAELARRVVAHVAEHSLMFSARPDAPVRPVRPSRTLALRRAARRLLTRRTLRAPWLRPPAGRRALDHLDTRPDVCGEPTLR